LVYPLIALMAATLDRMGGRAGLRDRLSAYADSTDLFAVLMPRKRRVPIVVGDLAQLAPGNVLVFADPRFEHRELREGLPPQSLYAVADFDEARRALGPY
jgi:hypothetical protein